MEAEVVVASARDWRGRDIYPGSHVVYSVANSSNIYVVEAVVDEILPHQITNWEGRNFCRRCERLDSIKDSEDLNDVRYREKYPCIGVNLKVTPLRTTGWRDMTKQVTLTAVERVTVL